MSAQGDQVNVSCSLDSTSLTIPASGGEATISGTATVTNTSPLYDAEYTIEAVIGGSVAGTDSGTIGPDSTQSHDFSISVGSDISQGSSQTYNPTVNVSEHEFIIPTFSAYDFGSIGVEDGSVAQEIPDPVGGQTLTLR